MQISQNEINIASALEPFKRYQYFLKRVVQLKKVYTLQGQEGHWASSTIQGHKLYPLWSAGEFARNCAIDGWTGFHIIETDLDEFIKIGLPIIKQEGFLLNIFTVGKRTGFVLDADEFVRDIHDEIERGD